MVFRVRNRTIFGDVERQVRLALDEVARILLLLDTAGLSDALFEEDLRVQLLLTQALLAQDQFWKEKARTQHFILGDRNNTYFHRVAKIKALTHNISTL